MLQFPGTRVRFLSCLYGSELQPAQVGGRQCFLSCLYGSERLQRGDPLAAVFLSCLYGSEQKREVVNSHFDISELPVRR